VIDYKRNVVIVHPPRCGGTSMEVALLGKDLYSLSPWEKHRSASELEAIIISKKLNPKDFSWFGLKRNPYDRVLSMFNCCYWNHTARFGFEKSGSLSIYQFVSLFGPCSHEGENFSLFDFHGLTTFPLYDVKELPELIQKIDPNLSVNKEEQRKYLILRKLPILARSVVFLRFWKDFFVYKYRIGSMEILCAPVAFSIILVFKCIKTFSKIFSRLFFNFKIFFPK